MTGRPGFFWEVSIHISLKELDLPIMIHPREEKRACGDGSPICPWEDAELAGYTYCGKWVMQLIRIWMWVLMGAVISKRHEANKV